MASRRTPSSFPPSPLDDELVGRQLELAAVREHLARGDRIVTISGPAGAGKSRLAREVAKTAGVRNQSVVVDLSHARDRGSALRLLARALDIELEDETVPRTVERFATRLRDHGSLLLVLDGVDHVPELAAIACAARERAPATSIILTARSRLEVSCAHAIELAGLRSPPSEGGEAMAADASRLFITRARKVRDGYVATREDARAIFTMVGRLEGLPAAIEIVASQMGVLCAPDLAIQTAGAAQSVAERSSGASPAAHALATALECAWDLLAVDERLALGRFAIFEDGFDLAAARDLFGGAGSVRDAVASLVDKSLLRLKDVTGLFGEPRFVCAEYVRDFVGEKLSAEEAAPRALLRRRHYAARASEVVPKLGHDPEAALRLELEVENLRAALADAAAAGQADDALRIATALASALEPCDPFDSRTGALDVALALPDSAASPALAAALRARGLAHAERARFDQAASDLDEASRLAPPVLAAEILVDTARLAMLRGDHGRARELAQAALGAADDVESILARARASALLAALEERAGHAEQALALFERAARAFADAERSDEQCAVLVRIADLERQQRSPAWTMAVDRALRLAKTFGLRTELADAHLVLAAGRLDAGRFAEAEAILQPTLALVRGDGRADAESSVLALLGHACLGLGRFGDAIAAYGRARELGARDDAARAARLTAWLAAAHAESRNFVVAGETFRAAAAHAGARDPRAAALTDLLYGYVDLASAANAVALSRRGEAAGHLAEASRRLDAARARLDDDDLRWAAHLVELKLAQFSEADAPSSNVDTRVWLIAPDGSAFTPPGGQPISIARRKSLKRMLVALARARIEQPGQMLTRDDLVAHGWPGDRSNRSSSLNRLAFSISTLRKLGLRPILETLPNGYRLDPATRVDWTDAAVVLSAVG